MPNYDFSGPEVLGYEKDGNPIWHCSSSIVNDITGIIRGVFASSKKDAKKQSLIYCFANIFKCRINMDLLIFIQHGFIEMGDRFRIEKPSIWITKFIDRTVDCA
ncbi:MAG: hypothetical protein E7609_03885 [Ruminococcaceae bacterium]|nr:hypothetical protein [Oscillospiraceae bacterium]